MDAMDRFLLEAIVWELKMSNNLAVQTLALAMAASGAKPEVLKGSMDKLMDALRGNRENFYDSLAQKLYPNAPEEVEKAREKAAEPSYIR